MDQIKLLKYYYYSIEPHAHKKTLKKQLHKKYKYKRTTNAIP